MTYWKTVGAYLTGWLITQSILHRVWRRLIRRPVEREQQAWRQKLATALVDDLKARGVVVQSAFCERCGLPHEIGWHGPSLCPDRRRRSGDVTR
jgi:hypothetical protein